VLQSCLTLSQQVVANDNWGQHTIPIIEAYPWTAFYFMGVFLSVSVAVMNLILGVVVNIALLSSEGLEDEIEEEQKMKKLCAHNDILRICKEMDEDGDGELSEEELEGFHHSEEFRTAIAQLNLSAEDLSIAFSTMDTGQSVSYVEFVKKLHKLKDSDAQFMLERIQYLIMQLRDLVVNKLNKTDDKISVYHKEELHTEHQLLDKISALDQLLHTEHPSASEPDNDKPDVVRKPLAPETCSPAEVETERGLGGKSVGSLELQIAAGGPGLPIEVLPELMEADFKCSLQNLQSNLELQEQAIISRFHNL